ncbi:MAG: ABC transporter substrate-binding protein [Proteobacteria bacterium]|nr:ABC transporter substrate-binding protein [Pseudomonadota bacterium]
MSGRRFPVRVRRVPGLRFGLGRSHLWLGAVILVLAVLIVAALMILFWKPAPPEMIIMTTGSEDSAYEEYGKRYQEILSRSGVEVILEPSSGGVENLEHLRKAKDTVTVGFVAAGLAAPGDARNLVPLGAIAYEALWLFYRSDLRIETISDLKGLRVAAGAEGSATRRMAGRLLEINGIAGSTMTLSALDGAAAASALQRHEVDVTILMATSDDAAVARLLRAPGVSLLSIRRADAYVKRIPSLVKVEVPEGAADMEHNVPATATTLLAVRTSLVTTAGVHPVLVDLLLDAARQIHGGNGLIRNAGEFPSGVADDLPVSPDAERYFKTGPSVLQSYQPYWAVVWVHRLVFFGFPIFVVLVPLLRLSPVLYRWSVRRRIYRRCGQKLGLPGGSSCIHMKIGFEQSSSTSSLANESKQPFVNWATRPRMR